MFQVWLSSVGGRLRHHLTPSTAASSGSHWQLPFARRSAASPWAKWSMSNTSATTASPAMLTVPVDQRWRSAAAIQPRRHFTTATAPRRMPSILTPSSAASNSNGGSSAKKSPSSTTLKITFPDDKVSEFDYFWLRDHCKCEHCWHPQTQQRLLDTFSVPMDVHPVKVQQLDEEEVVVVTWSHEQHVSKYPFEWLRRHSYNPPLQAAPVIKPRPPILWNESKIKSMSMPATPFEAVMNTEAGLAEWLTNIEVYGFATVTGVPPTPQDTERLARRIAFIRETHYGTFWDFTSNLAHGDTAYTNLAIGAHTDSTYFTDPIGLQLFHLLEHDGEGGHTLLIDGFNVAEQVRQKDPQAYKTLSTFNIPTHSAGDPDMLLRPSPKSGFPLIRTVPGTGRVYQIRYNNHDRSVLSPYHNADIGPAEVREFYRALKVWRDLVVDPANEFWYRMRPGTSIVVDNWRVMHGRSGFTGKRRLSGAYLNWDDYRSRVAMIVDRGVEKKQL